jgi:hypothetical protein
MSGSATLVITGMALAEELICRLFRKICGTSKHKYKIRIAAGGLERHQASAYNFVININASANKIPFSTNMNVFT